MLFFNIITCFKYEAKFEAETHPVGKIDNRAIELAKQLYNKRKHEGDNPEDICELELKVIDIGPFGWKRFNNKIWELEKIDLEKKIAESKDSGEDVAKTLEERLLLVTARILYDDSVTYIRQ